MAEVKKIRVDIDGNSRGLKDATKQANNSLNTIGSSAKKLGGVLAAAFAVGRIASFAKESAKLYDTQIKAETKLLTALKGRVDVQQRLMKQASELQKITLFGDETTIEAQAFLATMGLSEDAIMKLTPLVQDLATKMGTSLTSAADLVAKSVGSSTNALSRYGITIEGAAGSSERLESAVSALNTQVGGQSIAAAKVGIGGWVQLQNAIGDIKEEIGAMLVDEGSGLLDFLDTVVEKTGRFFTLLRHDGLALEKWQQDLLVSEDNLNKIQTALDFAQDEFKRYEDAQSEVLGSSDEWEEYNQKMKDLEPWIAALTSKFEALKMGVDSAKVAAVQAAADALAAQQDLAKRVAKGSEGLGAISDPSDRFIPNPDDVKERMSELEKILDEYAEGSKKRSDAVKAYELANAEETKQGRIQIAQAALSGLSNIVGSISAMQNMALNRELAEAGDNEEKKLGIRKEYAQKQKRVSMIQALINVAQGITAAMTLPPPASFIMAGLTAAAGAVQVAAIASQQFARGTSFAPGGMALVGERGPEVVNLPKGSSVTPNHMMGGGGAGGDIVLKVGEYEFARVINIATANQGSNVARTTF